MVPSSCCSRKSQDVGAANRPEQKRPPERFIWKEDMPETKQKNEKPTVAWEEIRLWTVENKKRGRRKGIEGKGQNVSMAR
jgi:hypothetical protein